MTGKEHIRSVIEGTEVRGIPHHPLFCTTLAFPNDNVSDNRISQLGRTLRPRRLTSRKMHPRTTSSSASGGGGLSRTSTSPGPQGAPNKNHKKRSRTTKPSGGGFFSHKAPSDTTYLDKSCGNNKRPRTSKPSGGGYKP